MEEVLLVLLRGLSSKRPHINSSHSTQHEEVLVVEEQTAFFTLCCGEGAGTPAPRPYLLFFHFRLFFALFGGGVQSLRRHFDIDHDVGETLLRLLRTHGSA